MKTTIRKPETDFEKWLIKTVGKESIADLANHCADSGFSGLTYYADTCKAYDKWHDEIWRLLSEMADDMGEENTMTLIASFNGAYTVVDEYTFKNLLVWAVCEETARNLVQE